MRQHYDVTIAGRSFHIVLAIGACTAAFSLIDALILRQLPVADPERLVYLRRPGNDFGHASSSTMTNYPFFEHVRQTTSSHMEAFSMSHQSLRQAVLPDAGGVQEKLQTQFVSGNAFGALGVKPAIGRLLAPSDDVTPGDHPVAVVSHAFWGRRLGGNPAVLGQSIRIEQKDYQIVGVTQAGFAGAQPGILTDIWLPNAMFRREAFNAGQWQWLQIWRRLRPDVARDALRPMLVTTLENFESDLPRPLKANSEKAAEAALDVVAAATGLSHVRQQFERPLLALTGIIAVVLLIACSNVANLLLRTQRGPQA